MPDEFSRVLNEGVLGPGEELIEVEVERVFWPSIMRFGMTTDTFGAFDGGITFGKGRVPRGRRRERVTNTGCAVGKETVTGLSLV